MNKRHLYIAIGTAAIIGAGALITTAFDTPSEGSASDNPQFQNADAEDGTWTCPMHPQIQRSSAANCPLCGMALVLQTATEGSGTNEFQQALSQEAQALAGIQVSEVRRASATLDIPLYGEIIYDQTRERTLSARFPARIEKLYVNFEGMRVNKGDHLATVYSPELLTAKRELLTASKNGEDSPLFKAARNKLELWGIESDQINEFLENQKVDAYLEIRSPVSGVVTARHFREGEYIESGSVLFTLAEAENLWVDFSVYESDSALLRYGQKVEFITRSVPDHVFEGRISFIAPEIDPRKRTLTARAYLENVSPQLRPGAYVQGKVQVSLSPHGQVVAPYLEGKWISPMHPEIVKDHPGTCDICGMQLVEADQLGYATNIDTQAEAVLVPASAVLVTGKQALVYLQAGHQDGRDIFEIRKINLGPRIGEEYLVLSGLSAGEKVVTAGAFRLDSTAQLLNKASMLNADSISEPERIVAKSRYYGQFNDFTARVITDIAAIQLSLAQDDLPGTKQIAAKTLAEIEESTERLPGEVSKDVAELADSLDLIAQAETPEEARGKTLEKLNITTVMLLKKYGTDSSITLYRKHCPMVYGSTGADWIQTSDELLNPYFGAYMLRCGEDRGIWDHSTGGWEE